MSSAATPATEEEAADPATGAGVPHTGAAELLLLPPAVPVNPGEADFRPGSSSPSLQTQGRRGISRLTFGMPQVPLHLQHAGSA